MNIHNKIQNKFGYCEYSFEKDYVHIYNLFISPEFRRMGHAREILSIAINEIIAMGHEDEILIVANPKDDCMSKEKLTSFYEDMGLKVFECYI